MKVRLVDSELKWTDDVGRKRQYWALKRGYRDQHGFDGEDGLDKHIEGACGELAVAKVLGLVWPATVNTFGDGADIGARIQVRTRSKPHYEMLIRPKDMEQHLEHCFVLVLGRRPDYTVSGWIKGCDARQPKWFKAYGGRPPAWFVPQDDLDKDFMRLIEIAA